MCAHEGSLGRASTGGRIWSTYSLRTAWGGGGRWGRGNKKKTLEIKWRTFTALLRSSALRPAKVGPCSHPHTPLPSPPPVLCLSLSLSTPPPHTHTLCPPHPMLSFIQFGRGRNVAPIFLLAAQYKMSNRGIGQRCVFFFFLIL